jgi:hypothetical protein
MITIDNFEAWELVDPFIYEKYGEDSLRFIDPRLKKWIEWFRNKIDRPVYANNYKQVPKPSKIYDERGYRSNLCNIVKAKTDTKMLYLSAHTRFQAIDFDVQDMLAEEVRQWIDRNKRDMPVNIRIEKGVNWVHVDVCNDTYEKIIYFEA